MLAFSKLGNYGRLGNQLFQYAFLREMAERLGTTFYCPKWDGDDIFDLQEAGAREPKPVGILHQWGPGEQAGYTEEALRIGDHTDIEGFFQSERYYSNKQKVRGWFDFRAEIRDAVERRFGSLSLSDCVSLSLRIDSDYNNIREYFPLYPVRYYERALAQVRAQGPILVFADRPDLAPEFLAPLKTQREMHYVRNLTPAQQLYLMTLCRDNVITNSTFAWWGAWLNPRPDKVVVVASSWNRPGVPKAIADILCDDWVKVRGTTPVLDHFQIWRIRHPMATLARVRRRLAERMGQDADAPLAEPRT